MPALELYYITIGQNPENGDYLGAIYSDTTEETGGFRDKSLVKVLREIGNRVKDKEKERRNFPMPEKSVNSLSAIVLPNGRSIT